MGEDFDIFISKLLEAKETDDVEFKSAAGGFPGSFWETYEEISNKSLRLTLNMHKADIGELLRKMCRLGYLESRGKGRGTTYHIPQGLMTKVAT